MPNETDNILLVTGGHPFEREPLFTLFDGLEGVEWTHVGQPAAQALFSVEHASRFDAFVCYDMPGIQLYSDRRAPDYVEPDETYKQRFLELLEAGQGFVFLHHAITSWPAWDEYAEIVGGRWQYLPGKIRGKMCQDSGFRQDVTHTVSVLRDHPVTRGVPESFQITDELYLYDVFDDAIEPLLASDFDFTDETCYSATKAVKDHKLSNEGWKRPPGSNLVGWTKTYGKSRIVYLQCGHDYVAFACPEFRLLLKNAIRWVAPC